MNAKPTAYPILGHKHSNGDARNRTEGNIGEKTTYLSPTKRGRSLRNKMKNIKETSMNEIEGGTRTLNAFTTP